MLNLQASQIETIVRVVLERLRAEQAAQPATTASQPAAAIPGGGLPSRTTAGDTCRIDQPLVTLEDLKRVASQQIKALQVGPRCVVTPAAHDELRRLGIRLLRMTASDERDSVTRSSVLVIASTTREQALGKPLAALGARLASVDETQAEMALAAHIKQADAWCVWCTPRPYAAVHTANRLDATVRCVHLPKMDDLSQAQQQVAPNVLVLNERDWSTASVVRLVERWIRSHA